MFHADAPLRELAIERREGPVPIVGSTDPERADLFAHNTLGAVVHNALRALFDQPPARRTPAVAAVKIHEL